MKQKENFEKWMAIVDTVVYQTAGLSVHDLEDYAYMDAYEAGKTPNQVAKAALCNAGY